MHIATLAPRNDPIHEPPDSFAFGFRRPYTSICEYRDSQITQAALYDGCSYDSEIDLF
jgi:hypothetical protein